jgi:molecular chaperone GrpE
MKNKENELPEEVIMEDIVEELQDVSTETGDDVSFEETNEEGEVDAKTTIKKLREKIKALEKEKQEYLDQSLRSRADYMNFKKEVDANKVLERKFATKRFIEELLPVLDAYDMAQGDKNAWEAVDKNWRMGIEYIFNQLKQVLEKEGVLQHGKIGEHFDPNHHESIELVKVTNESEHDKIVRVLQNGYRMHDTNLRPARVHVGSYDSNAEGANK